MGKETVLVKVEFIQDYSDKAYLIKLEGINGMKKLFVPKTIVINYNKVTKNIQVEKWWYDRVVEANSYFKQGES
jgi:hypothetical protein